MKPLLPVTRILDPREIVSLTSDMMSNNQNLSRHQSKMRCELEDQVVEKSPKFKGPSNMSVVVSSYVCSHTLD